MSLHLLLRPQAMSLHLLLRPQAIIRTKLGLVRSLHGGAVNVLRKEGEHSTNLQLDLAALRQVFENPLAQDKPACIVTVAGAMRTGKSFLLDQMLKHLQSVSKGEVEDSSPGGFPWRGGMNRFTSGVNLWEEPFIIKNALGEEMAVFLMDTQGTFDHKSTVKENMTVFALSTMTSSLLMYNLMHVIREDHLQHLQLFTEYGRLALKQSGTTPFQKLQFLVRDWHYPHDASFGSEGGRVVLDRLLATTDDQPLEIRTIREHILSSFTEIDCYLFPYPGPKVAEDPNFTGNRLDMDPRFARYLDSFVTESLSPDSLEPKRIAGKTVKSKEMVDYFQKYLEIFNGDEIPEPKSIFDTTAEVTNLHALNEAKENYIRIMGDFKRSTNGPVQVDTELLKNHQHCLKESLKLFADNTKFGGEALAKYYHDVLLREISEKFESFKKLNDSKILNIFHLSKEGYLKSMEYHFGTEDPLHQQKLVDHHIKYAKEATRKFQKIEGTGSKAFSDTLLDRLVKEIDERFVYYRNLNDAKIKIAVLQAVDSALASYSRALESVLEGPLSIHPVKLDYEHRDARKNALAQFTESSNFGDNLVTANEACLVEDIEDKFAYFRELNASKQFSKRLKATVEQLSDNETYKQFWSSPHQQKVVGGTLATLVVLKLLLGS